MWHLKIQDPSGETRITPIQGSISIGRDAVNEIVIRDPTLPPTAAEIWADPAQVKKKEDSPFWIRTHSETAFVQVGDLQIREGNLPARIPILMGESTLEIFCESHSTLLPSFPEETAPWLTRAEKGREILWNAKKVGETPLSVYIAGETGTGKELIANLIHAWSPRSAGPFVPLNCGALNLSLAESELFGHVKGAFTGALKPRAGALLQAHGGTLFLDEVGDLPPDIQVKLLRFLEDGEIRPVGADHFSHADVRIICATHFSLEDLVAQGKFRKDLFYRLASVTLQIPPLRERPEDIELLARQFALHLKKNLSSKALARLQSYRWPGNVRELRHAIERASGLSGTFTSILNEEAFEFLINPRHFIESAESTCQDAPLITLKEMEKLMILRALKLSRGNRSTAARLLGIARSTLFEMLKRYRIQGPKSSDFFVETAINSALSA